MSSNLRNILEEEDRGDSFEFSLYSPEGRVLLSIEAKQIDSWKDNEEYFIIEGRTAEKAFWLFGTLEKFSPKVSRGREKSIRRTYKIARNYALRMGEFEDKTRYAKEIQ